MFFCRTWSIGKVIDFAASIANLKNDNNKTTAKVNHLRQLSFAGNICVCLEVSEIITVFCYSVSEIKTLSRSIW